MATKEKFKPYICSECKEPCDAIEVDFGIGPYEFWGQRGCDRDVQVVSDCCESPLVDPDEYEPELPDEPEREDKEESSAHHPA